MSSGIFWILNQFLQSMVNKRKFYKATNLDLSLFLYQVELCVRVTDWRWPNPIKKQLIPIFNSVVFIIKLLTESINGRTSILSTLLVSENHILSSEFAPDESHDELATYNYELIS